MKLGASRKPTQSPLPRFLSHPPDFSLSASLWPAGPQPSGHPWASHRSSSVPHLSIVITRPILLPETTGIGLDGIVTAAPHLDVGSSFSGQIGWKFLRGFAPHEMPNKSLQDIFTDLSQIWRISDRNF
ncbi:hypothetical protein M0R45_008737 [Rubus argutus]|uniref:Uncharacterized protein n=1 Tax=Rubus argutus TaxID=59490 RepID=A0AAW1Y229_RUBAR